MSQQFNEWSQGCGVITHSDITRERIALLLKEFHLYGESTPEDVIAMLRAADVLCNMGMWLTVHMTYARNVYLDGRTLLEEDFKSNPEGHTGGALNMVPAYVGYLLANALAGKTRAWLMGQGHSVAAIDSVNILTGNLDEEQASRYPVSDAGLSLLCQDFYSYVVGADGKPVAPLGSHVNVYTAGGISEGGYLGFAELQYVHMPLPGQELVTFLSDGAFEEQRGSDWAPRWWRGEDTGNVMPVMIANGRRIDQRTTMAQTGGIEWFRQHLELNGFDPVLIDGRDPAAFAWAILTMNRSLTEQFQAVQTRQARYPVRLPYAIAETVKGFGFPGAGTNAAHNLPLIENPATDAEARQRFNAGAAALFFSRDVLGDATRTLGTHRVQGRPMEKAHCLRDLHIEPLLYPPPDTAKPEVSASPMAYVDRWLCEFIGVNPGRRFRIGNPDEMRSNRLGQTLDLLKHRVTEPEPGIAESVLGGVITALNEEAVISAALANKQGISLAVSYEAFAVKMLGAMRQEILFTRHLKQAGRPVEWPGLPVIVSSHTWENGKNEQSHQDPTLAEAWLGEMSDIAPVLFPIDGPTARASMERVYRQSGCVAVLVTPKGSLPIVCTAAQAEQAVAQGVMTLQDDPGALVQFIAIGAYQLQAVLRAAARLRERKLPCSVVALIEPGLFREGRDGTESAVVHSASTLATLVPPCRHRIIVCHTRPGILTGVLRRLDTGPDTTRILGYCNRGGTLDVFGMQYANRQTWAHVLAATDGLLADVTVKDLLDAQELAAVQGAADPGLLR